MTRRSLQSAATMYGPDRTSATSDCRRLALRLIACCILQLGISPLVRAAQVAEAVLEIVALDESGASLSGVTVTASRLDTGLQRTAVTDEGGLARLLAIPSGTYDVKLELPGFATVVNQSLAVHVGQVVRVRVNLRVSGLSETVNVVAQPSLVDVFKTDSSTNITPEQIESLPVHDRDFQRLAFLTPGVQRERGANRFIGNGPVIGAVGNASQSTIIVDGVDFTDPTLGLARARFSIEAISEFRVIANRFDAEIGGSAGSAISIVTRSGTNAVRGSAFGFFRDRALRAKGALDLQKNDYSRRQYGLTFGGPIVRDRTHYFGSFEQVNESAILLFRPLGAFVTQAADVPFPLNQSLLFGGADHRIDDRQSLKLKFVYERYRQKNYGVGGAVDQSAGRNLNRDNWNLTGAHSWVLGGALNQLSIQGGRRRFAEPNNSQSLAESFSSGNTLQIGANILGDRSSVGDIVELHDTFARRFGSGRWAPDIKLGGALQHFKDFSHFPLFPHGLMVYLDDTRLIPLLYVTTSGESDDTVTTNVISGFVQGDFRPSTRLSLNLGVRYDLDTNGNNPTFTSPLMAEPRGRDTDNFQPRAGFSWDVRGNGRHLIRGGAGLFNGRLLLTPTHFERSRNGFTGLIVQQRISGIALGIPGRPINPLSPSTTGIALARDAARNADSFVSPYAKQATAGYTLALSNSGLFADVEGVYVKGKDEVIVRDLNWRGNAAGGGRLNPSFNQIDTYTNEGRSEYKAFIASLNGVVRGHLLTASLTVASKKNINDDFSPALTELPSDPADIEAEWGRSRADERRRFVSSAILRLPRRFTVAPTFEYGSGQPWNARLGYDYNADGKASDRPAGTPKFSENGPNYVNVNLRVTHRAQLGSAHADIIVDMFNVLNNVAYDVNSAVSGRYLSGPTIANTALPYVTNANYGQFTRTLPPFEGQIGLRVSF